jgi:hypothetical protein
MSKTHGVTPPLVVDHAAASLEGSVSPAPTSDELVQIRCTGARIVTTANRVAFSAYLCIKQAAPCSAH